ncbi:ABC transporter transmembrane domain-containing protein [Verrucosispora sioxanthis]|uniref:ABC transporter transmembrane domain-containing protein n=1 Tax=Verrucosispora sioxanthis TaxID=2499994 RepID=UPI001EFF02D9|nr:ABC transporter transmembrane domain-containing protein [Verrucosispora sioxanthis]
MAPPATARLRRRLLRHLFALDVRAVRRFPVGDLVGRLAGQAADTGQAGNAVALGGIAALPPLGSVVALFLLEPVLGFTLLAGLAVLTVLMATFVTDASAVVTAYQRVLGAIAGRLQEALGGARTIAAAGTTDLECDRAGGDCPSCAATAGSAGGCWPGQRPRRGRGTAASGRRRRRRWVRAERRLADRRPTGRRRAVRRARRGLGAVLATLNRLVRSRAAARRIAEPLSCPVRAGGDEPLPPGGGHLRLRGSVSAPTTGRSWTPST